MQADEVQGFRLSSQQQRLWLLQDGVPDPVYSSRCTLRLEGNLDRNALAAAWRNTVERHEILRTAFRLFPGLSLPLQVIQEDGWLDLQEIDVSGLEPGERAATLAELSAADKRPVFDLRRGEVLRGWLVVLSPEESELVLALPSMCADVPTLKTLALELVEDYDRLRGAGRSGDGDSEPPLQYADVSEWQHQLLEEAETAAELESWREYWRDREISLHLALRAPFENGTAAGGLLPPFAPDSVAVWLDSPVEQAISALLARWEIPAWSFFLACWQMLLQRSTGREDVLVGVLHDGRRYEELAPALGPLARYVPVHCRLGGELRLREIVDLVRSADEEAGMGQERFSWPHLVGAMDPARPPYFPFCFSADETWERTAAGLRISSLRQSGLTDRFKLELCCHRAGGRFALELRYDGRLVGREAAELLGERLSALLRGAVERPDVPWSELEALGEGERRRVLVDFNDTPSAAPEECLHRLFERQAGLTPERIAVVDARGGHLTYAGLNARADRLAHHLRRLGIGPETLVALCFERSADALVAILGVVKAGGAWLPLDPAQPRERLGWILADTAAPVFLTQERLAMALRPSELRPGLHVLCLDPDSGIIVEQPRVGPAGVPGSKPAVEPLPGNLLYTIYTSGSTGRPKGVQVDHRAPVNLLAALQAAVLSRLPQPQEAPLRASLNAPLFFDASVQQIVLLLAGHTLHIVPDEVRTDGPELLRFLQAHALDLFDCTPSQLRILLAAGLLEEAGPVPQAVLAAGEAVDDALWLSLQGSQRTTFFNIYGPTECTVDATAHRISSASASPTIGRPIAGYEVYLLDLSQRLVPIGTAGELCLGGSGLARGYVGRPEATAERFVPHPFSTRPSARLYRTGDLARHLPGGEIEYLGRIDHQVKIRGYRIELGEIEGVLSGHPWVEDAVVVARQESPEQAVLAAYVLPTQEAPVAPAELQRELFQFLRERLPAYMVPAAYTALERWPLTPNGKVDRRALPAPDLSRLSSGRSYVAPRGPIEELVAAAWEEVLGVERVGIHENFFDLGGHSLLATKLISRLREMLPQEASVRQLFEGPTVAELAAAVEQSARAAREIPPIAPVSRKGALPLSFAQQRLWFLQQLEPDAAAYNLQTAVRLVGQLDPAALRASLHEVVRRHEALRTTFEIVEGEPRQVVQPAGLVSLAQVDLRGLPGPHRWPEAWRQARGQAAHPFDLAQAPLLRQVILALGEEEHVLLLTMHHIVSDGWSSGALVRELSALYPAFREGRPSPLPELNLQYADFAAWQRQWLAGEILEAEIGYWRGRLQGLPPLLELTIDRPRPAALGFAGSRFDFELPSELARRVRAFARSHGATLFMTLLASFQGLLGRYTGRTDIAVGSPIAGRNHLQTEDLIGFFVNTLVLRADLAGRPGFLELLLRVREMTLEAYAHQDLPFEKIVEALQPVRDLSYTPLFQVLFTVEHAPGAPRDIPGLRLERLVVERSTVQFDLTLSLVEIGEALAGSFEYSSELFDPTTIRRMAAHLRILLDGLISRPERPFDALPILTEGELQQVLVEWNDTRGPAEPLCIQQIFQARMRETPEAPAVISAAGGLTYRELDSRSNALARRLVANGVGPEVVVGLHVGRSPDLVVGMLGILKAGGAYLPLDPSHPQDRLTYMLEDSGARVVVTREDLVPGLAAGAARVLCLDASLEAGDSGSADVLPGLVPPGCAAYTIYTSGSTGRPKGVVIPHGTLANYSLDMARRFGLVRDDRVLQFAALGFDVVVEEVFPTLAAGGSVVLHHEDLLLAPADLSDVIERHAVTGLELPAAFWHEWVSYLEVSGRGVPPTLRFLLVGCDKPNPERLAAWRALGGPRLVFVFGLTETAVTSTLHLFPGGSPTEVPDARELDLPIGRPVADTRVHVLDREMNPLPPRAVGQLFIGGAGVGRGYLARPALTAERFIPDPFSEAPGARLYQTGDLSRYRPDGTLEFLGRLDHQVKIRGFRVEPEEVGLVLVQHPALLDASVLARQEPSGEWRLVAYVAARGEGADVGELRRFLRERLPEYMVPAFFISLEALPLTANGKVDREALLRIQPEQGEAAAEDGAGAPRNGAEELLVRIWKQVLRLERVRVHDNFFELGGDSILSIQITSRALQAGLRVTPRQMFERQTIAELAFVAEWTAGAATAETGPVTGPVPLTPVQRDFFAQDQPCPWHFNQALLLAVGEVDGRRVSPSATRCALAALLAHHDALRMRFEPVPGDLPRQVNDPPAHEPAFVQADLSALPPGPRREALESCAARLQTSLDLSAGPLFRAALFILGAGEPDRLLTLAHHLVVDGVSWRIVLEDLETLCTQLARGEEPALPPKTTSFRRWAERLAEHALSPAAEAQVEHWSGLLRKAPARLPRDLQGGANDLASARAVVVTLPAEETRALLTEVPRAYRTQINDVLLAALAQAMAGWTGDRRLLVDLEGHGREDLFPDVDLGRTVGYFTAIHPLLLDIEGVEGPGEALKTVKEALRSVPQRGIGYGLLRQLGAVPVRERLAALPGPEMLFNYLGQLDNAVSWDRLFRPAGESSGPAQDLRQRRQHLLEINGGVRGGQLSLVWTYSESLHLRSTIEGVADRFIAVLRRLIHHCLQPGAGGCTPSDFPLVRLDQATIDRLAGTVGGRIADIYPASPAQQGMLFHSLHDAGSGVYVAQMSFDLNVGLDVAAFEQAWREVVRRHTVLRSAFPWLELTEPVQVVLEEVELLWERHDWTPLTTAEQEERLAAFLRQDWRRPMDLARPPLMRLALLQLAEQRYRFVWDHHHLLLDGWSLPILWRELFQIYEAKRRGEEVRLEPARPFRDYVAWLMRQDLAAAEGFWRRTLAGWAAPTPLSVDRTAPAGQEEGTGVWESMTPAGFTVALRAFARRHQLTINTLVQGAWALLLSRYSGETDVVFGGVTSGRSAPLPGIEAMVGMFINTLPVRMKVRAEALLLPWLREVQEQQAEMRQYEYSPLAQVQGWSEVPRGRAMFESLLAFENFPRDQSLRQQAGEELRIGGVDIEESTNYPLNIVVAPGDDLQLRVLYQTGRLDGVTVARMMHHLQVLLDGMRTRAGGTLDTLPILTAAERHQALSEWNDTAKECPQVPLVHELCALHARRRPEASAVASLLDRLTYGELEARSNRLAHHLRSLGVGPDVLVAMCTERTLERVVGIVAILKAGGAYVSLDPAYPRDRLAFLLEDAGAPVLLTRSDLAGLLPESRATVICLDTDWDFITGDEARPPESGATPDNLAYVVYTSGSTGRPKGVEIPHAGLMNLVRWHQDLYGVKPEDRGTQIASPAFDASIWELWPYLAAGASVYIPDEETRLSSSGMVRWWAQVGITLAYLMTPLAEGVLEEQIPPDLDLQVRALIIGGDRLHRGPDPAVRFRLMNHYGPAEYSVTSTVIQVPPEGEGRGIPTIGRPVDNTQIYLLDRGFNPAPIGVPGELYVAGIGIARGYLRRPDLTAEKFIPDPFSGEPGARMYRTADLVRFLPDGDMDFIGRLDHQVKIRGLRIELGEIESVLGQYPLVREAAVLVREDRPGDKRLVAYLVPSYDAPDLEELRSFLRERLPEYMVPAAFVCLPELPLTPNGKVDRRALPAPDWKSEETYVAPRTPTEELLAGIWSEVLKVDRMGVYAGFFDLGGHSLLATQVISWVRKVFGVELPLRALFERPTVAELADAVEAALRQDGRAAAPSMERVPRTGPLPLSFGQQRLWFLDQLEPGRSAYSIPSGFLLRGPLHPPALERAFQEVVRRHEVLRTVFAQDGGEPVQVVLPPAPLPLPLADLSALPEEAQRRELDQVSACEARRPFDLARGPLLRLLCVRLEAGAHALLVVMHHIVSDGWSHAILLQEITELYVAFVADKASPLPELPVQYADFAHWQRRWLSGEVLQAELDHWRAHLADLPAPLELPRDRPRPARPSHRSASLSLRLPRPVSERLEALARREGATLFMTLLALFKVLLYRQTGQTDILLGTPVAGRDRAEIEPLIGFFLNTLVLRTDLSGEPAFTELLARVRHTALEAYSHQSVPFERLLQEVQPERDLRRTPLFQVFFNMLDLPAPKNEASDLVFEPLPAAEVGAAFDLTLYAGRSPQGIRLTATYDADLFDAVRVRELLDQLAVLAEQAGESPDLRIDRLSLVTPAARAVLPDPAVPLEAPPVEPVASLFLARMAGLPEAPAVCRGNRTWTYSELGAQALAVARTLLSHGASGRVVAVCGPRRHELIGAIAGVVLAGGVLLTLDRKLPEQRQRLMLHQAGASCLLYVGEPRPEDEWMFQEPGLTVLLLPEGEAMAPARFDAAALADLPMPGQDDPAYVFFTSGTTGIPKAVLGRQKGLSHFLTWQRETFGIGPDDRSAQLTGLSFDVVLRDIFLPLTSGAALYLPEEDDLGPGTILPWLEASGITVLHTVPSLASVWLERVPEGVHLGSLRWVFFAGEPLPESLLAKWRESFPGGGEVVNLYGPTETTLAKCCYRVPSPPAPGVQPVGFPLPQTQALVLGGGERLCGIGEPGEVALRTPFRSLGYLDDEEETRHRFRRNPFRDEADDLVYFTGDRGRYSPDGALELLGRVDDQVKIRGMRVEPEEVRAAIERHPAVRSSAVVAREDVPGDKRLVAYLVPEPGATVSVRELRRGLEEQLPDYMVPSAFVMLEALPLTPNGKLDRGALPAPSEASVEDRDLTAPRDAVERELVRIWEDLLPVRPIGVRDDFFELGGHSLLIVRLRARIEERFGRTLPVADFFRNATIEDMAAALRGHAGVAGPSLLIPLNPGGSLPPFFCVHPAGGDAAVYKLLAEHLGAERPFYGFQAKGLEVDEEPHRRVEEMARSYVEALRAFQPRGPYHLGGWSFGGRVAFEMAQLLAQQGEQVAALVLMDSSPPAEGVLERRPSDQTAAILALLAETVGLAVSVEDLLPLGPDGQLARVAAELVAAGLLPDVDAALSQLRRRLEVMKASAEAALHHEPRPYAGRIIYLRASPSAEESLDALEDPSRGWSHYTSQPMVVYSVPGDHYTMMQEPHVRKVAEILHQALRETSPTPAGADQAVGGGRLQEA